MKARRVKGLDPDASFADAARRIVSVRLDELHSFVPAALDPSQERALHDMRIAAKRLRYVLEVAEPCFGPPARAGAKRARALQDVLGELHDCDVLLPLVERHAARLLAEDALAVRAAAGGGREPDPRAVAGAPNRNRYRGLASLATYLRVRRELLHTRFLDEWRRMERANLREELLTGSKT
jgi:hypothetical protein